MNPKLRLDRLDIRHFGRRHVLVRNAEDCAGAYADWHRLTSAAASDLMRVSFERSASTSDGDWLRVFARAALPELSLSRADDWVGKGKPSNAVTPSIFSN